MWLCRWDPLRPTASWRVSAHEAEDPASGAADGWGRSTAVQADVSDPAACRGLVRRPVKHLGGSTSWCAAPGVEHVGPLASITPEDFQRVFLHQRRRPAVHHPGRVEAKGEDARIVLISCESDKKPMAEPCLYPASTAAVSVMAADLAMELAGRGSRTGAQRVEVHTGKGFTHRERDGAGGVPSWHHVLDTSGMSER